MTMLTLRHRVDLPRVIFLSILAMVLGAHVCLAQNEQNAGRGLNNDAHEINVVFSSDPIKTGYGLPVRNVPAPDIKKVVTATVTPKEETDNINEFIIDPATQNRATVTVTNRDPAAGKITLEIRGTTATPLDKPNGDTQLLARKDGVKVGSAMIIVVVPSSLQKPHPQADGAVAGVNMALDTMTSPAFPTEPGDVALVTWYGHRLPIQMLDQFGNPLDAVYAMQEIYESFPFAGGGWTNLRLSENGTYEDPVGIFGFPIATVAGNSPLVDKWIAPQPGDAFPWLPAGQQKAAIAADPPPQPDTQNIDIMIAGHWIDPMAIVNRVVTVTLPNTVKITWPNE